jgi:ABC-2 type transport system ATP-binding protein
VRLLHPTAVSARGLRRAVAGRWLLDGVDLEVEVGARLLVVARPEASASLLLGVLAGLARPATGSVRLAGLARDDETPAGWARRVAYVASDVGIYPWLTPREALDLTARLAGFSAAERRSRIPEAIEAFRITGVDRPISRGGPPLAQRTAMAAALLTDPEVLLLDDPLRSLDPDERSRLLRLPGQRRTVLLASRYPASEAGLVTQVALLRDGRLALHAGIDELDARGLPLSLRGIELLADSGPPPDSAAPAAAP